MSHAFADVNEKTFTYLPQSAEQSSHEPVRRVPLLIPKLDLFFWSKAWQAAEAEAESELGAGRGVTFDSNDPDDVARWLLEGDS